MSRRVKRGKREEPLEGEKERNLLKGKKRGTS
jgi:hypothetical protein